MILSLFMIRSSMPKSEIIHHFLPDDEDISAKQQPDDSPQVSSKADLPQSSLSPDHKENKSQGQRNHKQQNQGQVEEQEKLQDGSRGKRKWECHDEVSRVEIQETPIKSNSWCYSPPRTPRKPKATPAMKRRAMLVKRSVVFIDVAREVESMFPPYVLQDFGKKIKKARS